MTAVTFDTELLAERRAVRLWVPPEDTTTALVQTRRGHPMTKAHATPRIITLW